MSPKGRHITPEMGRLWSLDCFWIRYDMVDYYLRQLTQLLQLALLAVTNTTWLLLDLQFEVK